jgi:cactin
LRKLHETPDEKRRRRLAKKLKKHGAAALQQRSRGGGGTGGGGAAGEEEDEEDALLGGQFVWKLKEEHDRKTAGESEEGGGKGKRGKRAPPTAAESRAARAAEKERIRERLQEIERVKERRRERERERAQREEERSATQREAEAEQHKGWRNQENEFNLRQARRRSEIRIAEGRSKPIDVLYQSLQLISAGRGDLSEDEMGVESLLADEQDGGVAARVKARGAAALFTDLRLLDEPYLIFNNLLLEEMSELEQDLGMYMNLDKYHENQEFWEAMLVVCRDEIAKLQRSEAQLERARRGEQQVGSGLHSSVLSDVEQILVGKNGRALLELEEMIKLKMDSGESIDVEYWETLFQRLQVFKARARLREMHQAVLEEKLAELELLAAEEEAALLREAAALGEDPSSLPAILAAATAGAADQHPEEVGSGLVASDQVLSDEQLGCFAPLAPEEYVGETVLDEEEDLRRLQQLRRKVVLETAERQREQQLLLADENQADADADADADAELFKREASKGMGENEHAFNQVVDVEQQTYSWFDKYRPRKPRFFNRVRTGYQWTAYNRKHYGSDKEAMPPRMVM